MTTIELEQIIDRAIIDRVDKLVLQKCGLSILPASIGNLRDLKLLDLYKNNLKVIPESIGNLSKLTNLNLNLNQIITLPDSICQLTNLTSLVLSDNQLTSLPAHIGNLSNLTRLYVRGNLLTSFPPSMRNLSNLSEIYINDNPWNDLSNLQDIPNLKRVYFLGINLHRKYWTHLDNWKSEYLLNEDNPHLRQMLIDRIGLPQIVEDLTSFLNLSANKLNSLPQNLANLSSITHVDLNFYSSWTDLSGLQNIPNLQTVHCFNVMLERRY